MFTGLRPGLGASRLIQQHGGVSATEMVIVVSKSCFYETLSSAPTGQNARHFAEDIFRCIFEKKNCVFWLKLHWSLFLKVQLTTSHYLTNAGRILWRIYAAVGGDELTYGWHLQPSKQSSFQDSTPVVTKESACENCRILSNHGQILEHPFSERRCPPPTHPPSICITLGYDYQNLSQIFWILLIYCLQ